MVSMSYLLSTVTMESSSAGEGVEWFRRPLVGESRVTRRCGEPVLSAAAESSDSGGIDLLRLMMTEVTLEVIQSSLIWIRS